MELFLNLVWLSIAAGAVVALLVLRERRWTVIIATACLVALLFPIISITDDLASDPALAEEASGLRHASVRAPGVNGDPVVAILAAVVLRAPVVRNRSFVDAVATHCLREGHARVQQLRGPPYLAS